MKLIYTNKNLGKIYFIALLLIYILYLLDPIKIPLWPYGHSLVIRIVPFLMLIYLRRIAGGIETKLLLGFCLWLFITRIININNDLGKITDYWLVSTGMVCCLFASLCGMFHKKDRTKILDCFAALTAVTYSLFSGFGIYAALTRTSINHPFSPNTYIADFSSSRLWMFGRNCNTCAFWFFIGFFACVYLFFRCKNSAMKIVIALAALLNYLALALTYSRNTMISFSVCFSLICLIVIIDRINFSNRVYKTATVFLLLIAFIPLWYSSFSFTTNTLGKISDSIVADKLMTSDNLDQDDNSHGSNYETHADLETKINFSDNRGFDDSGRLEIYRSGLYSLTKDPIRLLKGCHFEDKMTIAQTVLEDYFDNLHNTFLDLTNVTGLPGLLIVFTFLVILGYKSLMIFFAKTNLADLSTKVAIVPLCGILSYNMLETALFFDASRSLAFFLLAGAVIANYKDIFTSKRFSA